MNTPTKFWSKIHGMNDLVCMNLQVQVVSSNDTPLFTGIPEFAPDAETDCWIIAGREICVLDIHNLAGAKVTLVEKIQ